MSSKTFMRGVWQGMTWPISWPLTHICFYIGHWAFLLADCTDDPASWWFNPCWAVYDWGMRESLWWNDIGGLSLWRR